MLRSLVIGLLIAAGMLGCSRQNLNPNDLTGTWAINPISRKNLPIELKNASATITFDNAGKFVARELPGFLYAMPGNKRIDSGIGSWELVSRKNGQQLQLNFSSITNNAEAKLPYGTQLYLSKKSYGVVIYYFIGDPDEGLKIELMKLR